MKHPRHNTKKRLTQLISLTKCVQITCTNLWIELQCERQLFHSFYFSLFVFLLFLIRIHHMSQLKMLNYLVHLLQCVAENFSRTMHRIQIISHKKCGSPEAVLPFNPIHTRSFTCGCRFKTNTFCFRLKYYFYSSAVKLFLLAPSWYTSFIMLIFVGNVFR